MFLHKKHKNKITIMGGCGNKNFQVYNSKNTNKYTLYTKIMPIILLLKADFLHVSLSHIYGLNP
jgi:hypothetical protein